MPALFANLAQHSLFGAFPLIDEPGRYPWYKAACAYPVFILQQVPVAGHVMHQHHNAGGVCNEVALYGDRIIRCTCYPFELYIQPFDLKDRPCEKFLPVYDLCAERAGVDLA